MCPKRLTMPVALMATSVRGVEAPGTGPAALRSATASAIRPAGVPGDDERLMRPALCSRTTAVPRIRAAGGPRGIDAPRRRCICSTSKAAAVAPMASTSRRRPVSGGVSSSATSRSSNEASARSSGIPMPRERAASMTPSATT